MNVFCRRENLFEIYNSIYNIVFLKQQLNFFSETWHTGKHFLVCFLWDLIKYTHQFCTCLSLDMYKNKVFLYFSRKKSTYQNVLCCKIYER